MAQMSTAGLAAMMFLVNFVIVYAWAIDPGDTATRKDKPLVIRTMSRVHSASFFYFGGKIAEENPAIDLSISVETPRFGYSFLKAADLADIHSSFNFALATVYGHLNNRNRIRFTPQMIVLIEQPNKLVDEGSDIGITFTSLYRVSESITIEETAICFNMVFETAHRDFINRLRLLYSAKHLDLTAMLWHNNNLLDEETHITSALSVAYNRVKISKMVRVGATLTASATLASSDTEHVAKQRALMLTISVSTLKN